MRIGGGALRGREVRVPGGVRPTGGRARKALFDIWAGRLEGRRFLDLFAGSGAVGIEAVGRGAAFCLAVERSAPVLRVLTANWENLLPSASWGVRRARLPEDLSPERLGGDDAFDLVFADPPYEFDAWAELLAGIASLLDPRGEAVIEHGRRNRPPETGSGLERSLLRGYGETELSFYSRSAGDPLPAARPR